MRQIVKPESDPTAPVNVTMREFVTIRSLIIKDIKQCRFALFEAESLSKKDRATLREHSEFLTKLWNKFTEEEMLEIFNLDKY